MNNLLKFELRKLFHGKSIWICSAVLLLIIGLSMFTLASFENHNTDNMSVDDNALTISTSGNIEYSGKYFLSSSLAGQVGLILSIFIPIFIASDFSQGVMKTLVSRRCSRLHIVFAKSIAVLVAVLIFSSVTATSSGIIGTIIWGFGGKFDSRLVTNILTQVLIICAMAFFYFSISLAVRKLGGAIASCVVSTTLVGALFSLASTIFNNQRIEKLHLANMLNELSTTSPEQSSLTQYAFISIAYIVFFTFFNIAFLRRSDIE